MAAPAPAAPAPDAEPGPVGLRALCAACARLYPDQPNPLQVTARVKYWLGGPDPLDYVSMYWHPGRPELRVPPHWHYVSLGLSDLHGDGRTHPPPDRVLLAARRQGAPVELQSGFGLEMSFRLACAPGAPPPTWPAALLQTLARYVFRTGVALCVGDHISWHSPLDGGAGGDGAPACRLRHMLVAEEPQLSTVRTPLGDVQFVQIVGATGRELRAAQRGTGAGVLAAMRADPACGGAWLVTDTARRASARGLAAARRGPADLAGVSTVLRWAEWTPDQSIEEESSEDVIPLTIEEEIKSILQKGLLEIRQGAPAPHDNPAETEPGGAAGAAGQEGEGKSETKMSTGSLKAVSLSADSLKMLFAGGGGAADGDGGGATAAMSTDSFEMWSMERALEDVAEAGAGAVHSQEGAGERAGERAGGARVLSGVHIVFNAEGGSLLPLALQGRVLHSRHFTWRCASGARAVTFVSEAVSGALVSPRTPYVATPHGWLQVLIPERLAREMAARVASLEGAPDSEEEEEAEEEAGAAGGAARGAGDRRRLPLALLWPRARLKITILHPDTPLF